MEKTYLTLLQAHAVFEEQHPGASLEDFYWHMANQKTNNARQPKTPPDDSARLTKAMGRISSLYQIHLRAALKGLDMKVPEGFPFLASLHHYGKMRKTDLISFVLVEFSTGSEIMSRLKKQGLITEMQDENDKRAKIVAISEKGQTVIIPCLKRAAEIRSYLFGHTNRDEIKAVIEVLEPLEEIIAKLPVRHQIT
ncbi:MarR family winged helix-turn-helix transcriptional regulator [Mucilaginibacter sp. HD30]